METSNLPATQETGIDIVQVQNIIGEAPVTLVKNQTSTQRAVEAANKLIENAGTVGMSDPLDEQMAKYLERAKITINDLNTRRKPFTQMVDMLKKEFTGLESQVKAKIDEVQKMRDGYATKKMEEQRAKERIAQLKLDKEREAIDLKQRAETMLSNSYNEHLKEAKQLMLDDFAEQTLETLDGWCDYINGRVPILGRETYKTFRPALAASYHTAEECIVFVSEVINTMYPKHRDNYVAEIVALQKELIDKKESKRTELQNIAQADATEKARLEEDKQKREAEEKARIDAEAQAAKEKAEAEAATQAAGDKAAAMVDAQAEIFATAPDVKEGYEIIVKNPAANLLLAQMWFENEGKKLPQGKIDKVTFARIRKFCEAHALKTGELVDSQFIEYKPIYRAK